MKTKIFALVISVFLFSCTSNNNKESETANSDSANVENVVKPETGKKYSIKSGMIKFKSVVMGMQQEMTTYFDDFGNTEVVITKMEILKGQVNENRSILKDGYMYEFDMSQKTGTKRKMTIIQNSAGIDFNNLTSEVMGKMSLKNEGKVNFLGKECDKFSIDFKEQQLKGSYVVWQNIPLKTDVVVGKMPMTIEATDFKENISIPADLLEIPKDIKIKEF